jgi:hypothetical protein
MPEHKINDCFMEYYRCPESYARLVLTKRSFTGTGYFCFGEGATCYGACYGHHPTRLPQELLCDASADVEMDGDNVILPFDPGEVIENLRSEEYAEDWRQGASSVLAKMYYFVRPALPVGLRKHLQRLRLRGWDKRPFPRWPVDCSVDNIFEQLMLHCITITRAQRIPFIWFWPEGHSSCAIMTHDVETKMGRDFCPTLMDIDDSFGIKSSFQVIPEERYTVSPEFLDLLRCRQFEVVVHDLNHDGNLYKNREQFQRRAARINSYRNAFGADGFRAGVLYRKQVWYDALKFSYDMSVPNVAHLDPQHGGCCTVMPYFLGNILEIPVTAVQDYTLFNILNDYSIDLWKQQTEIIMEKHGLMSFIVHPDYVMKDRELVIYKSLLAYLVSLREEKNVWITTPGEVNLWWRQRAAMRLVEFHGSWRIEGAGAERARVAYASVRDGHLEVTLEEAGGPAPSGEQGAGADLALARTMSQSPKHAANRSIT